MEEAYFNTMDRLHEKYENATSAEERYRIETEFWLVASEYFDVYVAKDVKSLRLLDL